jgi:pimeloyl-ACP methyl ester carboxylesterase
MSQLSTGMKKIAPKMYEVECPEPKVSLLGKAGQHTMMWLEWGEPTGKPLVCVHGLTRNAHDFDYLAAALVEKGYRVICPDIVGRGRSEWLKNPKLYSYPTYCADMLHLLQHLKLAQVDWVGTSMGGLIGMMLASSQPQLIRRLVLNDIGSFIPKASLERIGRYISQRIIFTSLQDGEDYLRNSMVTFGIHHEAHWQHLAQFNFTRQTGGQYHIAHDPALKEAFRLKNGKLRPLPDMDFTEMWQKITCPVLVLRGAESDLLLKETAEKMAQRKGVILVEFPNCGHAPMLMDQSQIEPVVVWLG